MSKEFIAKTSIAIDAPLNDVWDSLINPAIIKKYMFGTEVVADWKKNTPIVWKGSWQGKQYQDKGVILEINPNTVLKYTHFSPLSGVPDIPENYHTLTFKLVDRGTSVQIILSQDNNHSKEEQEHAEKMYETMLVGLKSLLENK
jgi:uncharacterized protein YndB with AHSA1/START domain